MPRTRHAAPGDDPNNSPERHLSSPLIAGINIPMSIVCRVARHRSEAERRAMIWLTNYSLLRRITADALSLELDVEATEIRRALTDPAADLGRFVRQVKVLREQFEASIPDYVDTEVARTTAAAIRFASKKCKIVELVGKTRMGKSTTARAEFLRRLDRATWFDCPSDDTARGFYLAMGKALGLSTGTAKKVNQIVPQILGCFGPGLIDMVFVDEGHFLWPSDARTKPQRLEFLRVDVNADERRAAVIVFATPQHTTALNESLSAAGRWAPGQWEGRAVRFHCPDTMSEEDLAAIARHHCPEATDEMVDCLVMQAMATEGFAGAMVNTIELARFLAGDGKKVAQKQIDQAQEQMARGSRFDGSAAEKVVEFKRGTGRKGRRAA